MTAALAIVPTYNERDSLPGTVRRILEAAPELAVLVVDDNSPDGTGRIADELAAADARVSVLHREGKSGLGSAYVAGFRWALARDYDIVFEVDADGSHQPEELPRLLQAIQDGADLAIGTRWMPGGRVENWPLHRRLISHAGTLFARVMLGSRLRDITSGFRGYRADALRALDLSSVHSHGYSFQIEMAWLVERAGRPVAERPITFIERESGASKMSMGIVLEAMMRVFSWGVRHRANSIRRRFRRGSAPDDRGTVKSAGLP